MLGSMFIKCCIKVADVSLLPQIVCYVHARGPLFNRLPTVSFL